ncbi:MAG TPA: hypothetical protein VF006_19620 [Longimicrobium sp.]
MADPTPADWDRLRALCQRAEIPTERVDRLAASWTAPPAAGAVTLVAGAPATLALLLARWLGADTARALPADGETPLVIGPHPETVQPSLGEWPGRVNRKLGRHLVVIPSAGPIPTKVRSSLAALGVADQLLLASRLSQPLPTDERRLAASLAPLAATARVVFVGLPSEETSPAERAELAAFGCAQLEANGFRDRCGGAGVWYTEPPRPADTVAALDAWLAERPEEVAAGRTAAGRAGLARLLADIEKAPDRQPDVELSAGDADELGRKFAHHLSVLGQRVHGLADAGEFADTAACRAFVVDTLTGWSGRASLEGMMLDYAESVRPGIRAELPAQAAAAAELLHYTPPPPPPTRRRAPGGRLLRHLALTLVVAVAVWAALYFVALPFLRPWAVTFLSNVGATAAALATFSIARRFSRAPAPTPEVPAADTARAAVKGWASAELRLTSWFNGRIRARTPTLRQECAAIRTQFSLEG